MAERMKLSEAIRQGGARFGAEHHVRGQLIRKTEEGAVCVCALGAALSVLSPIYFDHLVASIPNGRDGDDYINYAEVIEVLETATGVHITDTPVETGVGTDRTSLDDWVVRLNDHKKLPFAEIADAVAQKGH